jgi:hypothetical protein
MAAACARAERYLRTPRRWTNENLVLASEADLHESVVRFFDASYGRLGVRLETECGALQTTPQLRLAAYTRGYCRGQPDLKIPVASGKYSGLALEFKSPKKETAVPSADQAVMHAEHRERGYLVVVTRSYEESVLAIHRHMKSARVYRCECGRSFCGDEELERHVRSSRAARKRRRLSDGAAQA